jgi:hypothetical protein
LLPPDHLDVNFTNFVAAEDGDLHYVDDEFAVDVGVDGDLARFRSLWHFARDLVVHRVQHVLGSTTTVDELAQQLAEVCDPPLTTSLDEFRRSEAEHHAMVGFCSIGEAHSTFVEAGRLTSTTARAERRDQEEPGRFVQLYRRLRRQPSSC